MNTSSTSPKQMKKKMNMSESKTIANIESYPPLFRQPKNPVEPDDDDDDDDSIKWKWNHNPIAIPQIEEVDLECINLDHLGAACKDWGIFRLINHGVPTTLLNQLQDHAKHLFSLPFESKQSLFNTPMPITYFWGTPALSPSGVPLSRGPPNMNWVEGFNVPLSQLSHLPHTEDPHPMVVTFRLLLEEYGMHLARLASTIYEAMAKNLKLDSEKYSKYYIAESTGIIRVYRYLQCSDNNRAWGMDVHTDSSILSILNQDEVGGLQVLKDDNWIDIEPIPSTLIVNLGDMMQAMSDDEYKSVKHRVKVNKSEERISICYFVFPSDDGIIQSSRYKPFSYGDFRAQVQEDVKTLGFKVGLDRFKLD